MATAGAHDGGALVGQRGHCRWPTITTLPQTMIFPEFRQLVRGLSRLLPDAKLRKQTQVRTLPLVRADVVM
jgi:hypothetical protein